MRGLGLFILGLILTGVVLGGCGRPASVTKRKPSIAEEQLSKTFEAIDASNAGQLFVLLSPKEVETNSLTVTKLSKILEIYRREIKGYTVGPTIFLGSDDPIYGQRLVKDGTSLVCANLPSWRKGDGVYVVQALINAIAGARGYRMPGSDHTGSVIGYPKNCEMGLKALRHELVSAGITKVAGMNEAPFSIDEIIAGVRKRYQKLSQKYGVSKK